MKVFPSEVDDVYAQCAALKADNAVLREALEHVIEKIGPHLTTADAGLPTVNVRTIGEAAGFHAAIRNARAALAQHGSADQ